MAPRSYVALALLIALPERATAEIAPQQLATVAGPDILGTVAVPIRADRFKDCLSRARQDASSAPLLRHIVEAAEALPRLQQLSFVQRAVSAKIHWMSDATEWGQHDYWASAFQTLARGAGDDEDRAIVKLHALRALGFNNSDLFLTLARDRVGGPITVLLARSGGHYYVLDDTGGPPFAVEQRRLEFQPIMSFGMYGAWVHVRPNAIASRDKTVPTLASARSDWSTVARK